MTVSRNTTLTLIWQPSQFCTGGCDAEAEESPLLEAVTREWLVKLWVSCGDLYGVEINDSAAIAYCAEVCV
jgi:hypothetical protein